MFPAYSGRDRGTGEGRLGQAPPVSCLAPGTSKGVSSRGSGKCDPPSILRSNELRPHGCLVVSGSSKVNLVELKSHRSMIEGEEAVRGVVQRAGLQERGHLGRAGSRAAGEAAWQEAGSWGAAPTGRQGPGRQEGECAKERA